MQTVFACGGGGGGSQQREVADGADVVTDTAKNRNSRNPPKFTKSSVYINQIPPSATKSTYISENYLNPT